MSESSGDSTSPEAGAHLRTSTERRARSSVGHAGELPVFSDFYGLFVWSFARAEGFPKILRPTLTQRFLSLLIAVLESLLELRYRKEREALFRRVNLDLEKLRVLSRALHDRRALSTTQYAYFHRVLDGVGRQLGGWMKACREKRRR